MKKNIWKVFLSQFIGNLGSQCLSFALGLLVLRTTGSATDFGIILLINPAVALILTPLIGYLVDRKSRKKIVFFSQIFSLISIMIFGILYNLSPQFSWIFLLILLLSIGDKFLSTAFNSSLSNIVGFSDLKKVNSLLQIISSITMIIAPIIGSILYSLNNINFLIFITFICEFCCLMILKFIDFKENKSKPLKEEKYISNNVILIWENFLESINYIKKIPLILFIISTSLSVNLFMTVITIGIPFILINHFNVSNFQYGITEMALAVGILAGGYKLSREKTNDLNIKKNIQKIYLISLCISISFIPILLNFNNYGVTIFYFSINFFISYLSIYINTTIITKIHEEISEEYKGRVFSAIFTIIQVFNPLGILIFSWLFENYSSIFIFLLAGLFMFASVFFTYRRNTKKLNLKIS